MQYIIAVFRSRKETLDLMNKLENNCISGSIVNTPRKISIGCGISVKLPINGFTLARCIVNRSDYNSFLGFYRYDKNGKLIQIQ